MCREFSFSHRCVFAADVLFAGLRVVLGEHLCARLKWVTFSREYFQRPSRTSVLECCEQWLCDTVKCILSLKFRLASAGGDGGGATPLYKPYRCVPPHRVGFLGLFGLKTGIDFAHFGLESGMVFEGTTECMNIFIVSIPNEKESRRNMRIPNRVE